VENKEVFPAVFISVLLMSVVAGTYFVSLARGNPFAYESVPGLVSPPSDVSPPSISLIFPKNDTIYVSNNVTLTFEVNVVVPTLPELFYCYVDLSEVYYKASWLRNVTYLNVEAVGNSDKGERFFSEENYAKWNTYWAITGYEFSQTFHVNLTGVPRGTQSLKIFAVLSGGRQTGMNEKTLRIYTGRYELGSSSMVTFTVDSPSVLSPQNTTYTSRNVPLLFSAHESAKQVAYSIDGHDKVSINGNTTLTNLPNGDHNVTLYLTDINGNTGTSETQYFGVAEPFPTTIVIASVITVVVVSIGLLVYFKKRKH
jgi:hypothetical protein